MRGCKGIFGARTLRAQEKYCLNSHAAIRRGKGLSQSYNHAELGTWRLKTHARKHVMLTSADWTGLPSMPAASPLVSRHPTPPVTTWPPIPRR